MCAAAPVKTSTDYNTIKCNTILKTINIIRLLRTTKSQKCNTATNKNITEE